MSDKWEKGDIAICVNNSRLSGNSADGYLPALRIDYEYIVHGVKTCECGVVDLDVGLCSPNNVGTRCMCGAMSSPKSGIHWAAAVRFVKKRTHSAEELNEAIEQAVEREDYELAGKLRDHLKQ